MTKERLEELVGIHRRLEKLRKFKDGMEYMCVSLHCRSTFLNDEIDIKELKDDLIPLIDSRIKELEEYIEKQ